MVHILHKPLLRKIGELNVFCSNVYQGCEAVLKMKDLYDHLSGTESEYGCEYASISCPDDCGSYLLLKDMEDHLDYDCVKRVVTCGYCSTWVAFDWLDAHYYACEKSSPCPRFCGGQFLYEELKEHELHCPNMLVTCPFKEAGCHVEVLRKQEEEHAKESAATHLQLMMATCSALRADVRSLKLNNDSLAAENNSITRMNTFLMADAACSKADFEHLKAENESLREESEASKKGFKSFREQLAVAIADTKGVSDSHAQALKWLEFVQSSLKGYHLDCVNSSITFCIPTKTMELWHSPPFTLSPSCELYIRVNLESVLALGLDGEADSKEWPGSLKKSITVSLSWKEDCAESGSESSTSPVREFVSHTFAVSPFLLHRSKDKQTRFQRPCNQPIYVTVRLTEPELRKSHCNMKVTF